MRFCPFCSAENADELAVCQSCGRRLPPLPPRRPRNAPPTGVLLPPRSLAVTQPPPVTAPRKTGTTNPPPTLTISRGTGGALNVSWTNGGTLQSTASLAAPITWTDVTSTSPFAVTGATTGTKFYRVR